MWFGDGNAVWHKETPNFEITRALMNKTDARGEDSWPFPPFSIFFSLQLSSLVCPLMSMSCRPPLEERSWGVLVASVASRSVSGLTREWGFCLSWQPLRCPRGPDRLSNLSSWKSQPDGGRDGSASGNLTTCLPAPPYPTPSPLSSLQQGKLYRPKGRLTSPEQWNRSD